MAPKILHVCSVLPLPLVLLFAACGGGTFNNSQVAISISPTMATLNANQQQQFQARVTGSSDMIVHWQVNGIAGGNSQFGTITASGLYTAPTSDLTLQVSVTAVADANQAKTASAQVTVNGVGVSGKRGRTIRPTRAAAAS